MQAIDYTFKGYIQNNFWQKDSPEARKYKYRLKPQVADDDAFKYMYGHYGFAETTENAGNWSNTIFNLTHIWRKEGKRGNWGLSYNRYETWQGQRMDYLSTDNILAIRSLLNEGEFRFCQEVDQTIGGIFS